MKFIVTEQGQVTIPRALRDKLDIDIDIGAVFECTTENGRLIATKRVDDHPALRLLGKRSRGRSTVQVMNELRAKPST